MTRSTFDAVQRSFLILLKAGLACQDVDYSVSSLQASTLSLSVDSSRSETFSVETPNLSSDDDWCWQSQSVPCLARLRYGYCLAYFRFQLQS